MSGIVKREPFLICALSAKNTRQGPWEILVHLSLLLIMFAVLQITSNDRQITLSETGIIAPS